MGSELHKIENNQLTLRGTTEARRTIDAALARLRSSTPAPTPVIKRYVTDTIEVSRPRATGEVIDLPRYCAVHGRPYVARYVQDASGRFRFGQSIQFKDSLAAQYKNASTSRRSLSTNDCDEESCPWCGAQGWGAILCGECENEVCYGRTDAREWFNCFCGASGQLRHSERGFSGISPVLSVRKGGRST